MTTRLQRANGSSATALRRCSRERRPRSARTETRLEPLIGSVYEASVRPDGWRPALASLAEAVGADAIALLAVSAHGALREMSFNADTSESAETSYREHFAAVDPWVAASAAEEGPTAGVAGCRVGPDAVQRERCDGGYYHPPGWQHGFAARLLDDAGSLVAAIAGHRLRPGSSFDAPALALVRQLVPHLRRSLRIGHELALAALERDASALVLDRIATGVLVVDGHARLLRANAHGASVLAARDGLSLGKNGLEAASHTDTRALRGAIADALQTPEHACAEAGTRLALARPSGARPYLVDVTPLDRAANDREPGRALAMIAVSDGESAPVPKPDALRMVYGLTRAEAELAIRLAQGRSLDEIRAERGVTSNTARGQLKKVFRKTGTHRQADLVRVVLQGRNGRLGVD